MSATSDGNESRNSSNIEQGTMETDTITGIDGLAIAYLSTKEGPPVPVGGPLTALGMVRPVPSALYYWRS